MDVGTVTQVVTDPSESGSLPQLPALKTSEGFSLSTTPTGGSRAGSKATGSRTCSKKRGAFAADDSFGKRNSTDSQHSYTKSRGKLNPSDVFQAVAWSRHTTNKVARRQVVLTLCGAGLIVLSFMIITIAQVVNQLRVARALDGAGLEIQRRLSKGVLQEVAQTLMPVYTSTMRLAEQAKVGAATGSSVWPPTREAFDSHRDDLLSTFWVQLKHDAHLRSVRANGSEKEHIPFLGVQATIAVQDDVRSPATGMEECAHVLKAAMYAVTYDPSNQNGGTEFSADSPYKLTFQSMVVPAGPFAETTMMEMNLFDTGTHTTFPFPIQVIENSPCALMDVAWNNPPLRDEFKNFFWSGPSVQDSHRLIAGNAPLYTPDGKIIGYFGSEISVFYSVNPVLSAVLEEGGSFTTGAELLMLSETGALLGASEFKIQAGPETQGFETDQFSHISDIPDDSLLGHAIALVQRQAIGVCPMQHTVIDGDYRLIDVMPFYAEDYGMPPLNERWCLIITYPRENIYEAIDKDRNMKIISSAINMGLFLCAIILLIVSLYLALTSDRGLRRDKLAADVRYVRAALEGVRTLDCPMALVAAYDFLQLGRLEHHESLRDRNMLTVLDSIDAVRRFKERNMILFFSHQWLSFSFPDADNGVQFLAMRAAIQTVLSEPGTVKEVYVWCDFISIAQRHVKIQQAAINSLPVYASMADKFIVIAPPAVHEDLACECNLDTYTGRGWCRAEMLAKACGSGITEMYTCTDTAGSLCAVTVEDLSRLSLNIFQGRFSVEEDIEVLVKPALGLYSLVLREQRLPHMQVIYAHIQAEKDKFFPKYYQNKGQRVELFGQCVKLMEQYIAQQRGPPSVERLRPRSSSRATPPAQGAAEEAAPSPTQSMTARALTSML